MGEPPWRVGASECGAVSAVVCCLVTWHRIPLLIAGFQRVPRPLTPSHHAQNQRPYPSQGEPPEPATLPPQRAGRGKRQPGCSGQGQGAGVVQESGQRRDCSPAAPHTRGAALPLTRMHRLFRAPVCGSQPPRRPMPLACLPPASHLPAAQSDAWPCWAVGWGWGGAQALL